MQSSISKKETDLADKDALVSGIETDLKSKSELLVEFKFRDRRIERIVGTRA